MNWSGTGRGHPGRSAAEQIVAGDVRTGIVSEARIVRPHAPELGRPAAHILPLCPHLRVGSVSEVELIRFVVLEVENRSRVERGLLRGSSRLQRTRIFSAAEEEFLKETFKFFNTHLPNPERVAQANRPGAEPKAVSWFKPAATRFIARMQDLAAMLEAHGIHTKRLTTSKPGFVVYEDEYQVVAEAFRDRR